MAKKSRSCSITQDFDNFVARILARFDSNAGFRYAEVFSKKFNERNIRLAIDWLLA